MSLRIEYAGPARLRANQLFSAVLRVVADRPIVPGGRVAVATRHVSDFGDPQMADPRAENFLTVDAGPDARWELLAAHDGKRHPWNRGIDLRLAAGEVPAGRATTLHLADPATGCPGWRCQSFVESRFRFRLGIDADGAGEWEVMDEEDCPGFEIIGAAAATVRVFIPAPAPSRSGASVCIKPEDVHGNVAGVAEGQIRLLLDDSAPLGIVRLAGGQCAQAEVELPADGTGHRVTAASDDGTFFARSNPVGPSPVAGMHLYWGEIHAQSGLCDGTNSPAELYDYARNAARVGVQPRLRTHRRGLEGDQGRHAQRPRARAVRDVSRLRVVRRP